MPKRLISVVAVTLAATAAVFYSARGSAAPSRITGGRHNKISYSLPKPRRCRRATSSVSPSEVRALMTSPAVCRTSATTGSISRARRS